MSKTVAVLSKVSGLAPKLKEVLPSVNFIEVLPSIPDSSLLQNAEIIVGDFNLIGPYLYTLPKIKWVQGTWAGLDALLPHVKKDNPPPFPITRTSGENFGQLMGEYVFANIVFWERNYFKVKENQNLQIWDKDACPHDHRSIKDLKIGILGTGAIGSRIGKTLNYLGATIYGLGRRDTIPLGNEEYKHISKYFKEANVDEMLSSVDYFINILPNTNETNNFLGNGLLQNCKGKNVVFINIGRGSIIKESELIQALKEKWISGAILDVFETEPLPKESELWKMSNVFLTPHIAGNSRMQDIAAKFKENFDRLEKNETLLNQIDFVRGY